MNFFEKNKKRNAKSKMATQMPLASVICVLLGIVNIFVQGVVGHVIVVNPGEKECFYELLKPDDRMAVTFQMGVGQGDNMLIDFEIRDPQGHALVLAEDLMGGDKEVVASSHGMYTYCFVNVCWPYLI